MIAQQLVTDNPNDSKNLYALANLYEKFNKIPEAEAIYKKVAEHEREATPRPAGPWPPSTTRRTGTRRAEPWAEGSDKAAAREVRSGHRRARSSARPSTRPITPATRRSRSFYWDKAYS